MVTPLYTNPLYNGYNIILKLQQKHYAKSYAIGWLLVYAATRSKKQDIDIMRREMNVYEDSNSDDLLYLSS